MKPVYTVNGEELDVSSLVSFAHFAVKKKRI